MPTATGTDTDREMQLSEDFVFSQSSLQTLVDCKRKFWLTYLSRVPWPSVLASPPTEFERIMRLGSAFHRLVQRAEEGVTGQTFPVGMEYPLESWFQAYQSSRPTDMPTEFVEIERTLETEVSASGSSRRLMAKYDLIAVEQDRRAVIMDWKTGGKIPRPAVIQQKMQTSVYPFVLVEASSGMEWGPVAPHQVEMRYWFVSAPDQPIVFGYDATQHEAIRNRLSALVREVVTHAMESDYPKVVDTEQSRKYVCGFCNYRGLCDRGMAASDVAALDEFADDAWDAGAVIEFHMDDIEPIAF